MDMNLQAEIEKTTASDSQPNVIPSPFKTLVFMGFLVKNK
jgi:hypothetical protein